MGVAHHSAMITACCKQFKVGVALSEANWISFKIVSSFKLMSWWHIVDDVSRDHQYLALGKCLFLLSTVTMLSSVSMVTSNTS